jgi:hypothetical protein
MTQSKKMAHQKNVAEKSLSLERECIETELRLTGEEGSLDGQGPTSDETTPNPKVAEEGCLETTAVIKFACKSTDRSPPTTGSSVSEVITNQRLKGRDCPTDQGRVNFPVRGLWGQIGVYLSNRRRQAVVLSLWLGANAAVFGYMYAYAAEKPEYPIAG